MPASLPQVRLDLATMTAHARATAAHTARTRIRTLALSCGTVATDISLDEKADTATFTFEKELPLGHAKLHVTFVGQLNDQMAGFYRTKYAARDGSQK